jgi:hypothetical protein
VNNDGTLSSCVYTVLPGGNTSFDFAVLGTTGYLLATGTTTDIYACTVNPATVTVSNCAVSDGGLSSIDRRLCHWGSMMLGAGSIAAASLP